jgi:ATP-binding cassette subfamily B protein
MPSEVYVFLKDAGIKDQDILYSAETDLNAEGAFAEGYLVLTRQILGVIQAPSIEGKAHYFRGSNFTKGGKIVEEIEDFSEDGDEADVARWHAEFIKLSELDRVWIENCVGCNLLAGKWGNKERCLLMFTHLQKRRVAKLVRSIEQMKRGEEPDFGQEGEEYCPKCGRMYPDRERKVCPNCMDKRNVFFRVFHYFKPYRVQFVFMLFTVICTSLLHLVWPYLNGDILYDKVLARDESFLLSLGLKQDSFVTVLLFLVLAMAGTKLIMLLFQMAQGVLTAQMVVGVVRDLKKDVFRKMGRLSISFYRSRQTGSLMTRVLSDAERITGFFVDGAPFILIHGLTMLATIVVMFLMNPFMAMIMLVMLPILFAMNRYLRPRIWVMFGRRHRAERSLNSLINDNLTGSRVVKSFGQEKKEIGRFMGYSARLREAEIAISLQQNYFQLAYVGARELAVMAVWALGVYFIMQGTGQDMNLGFLITFVGYVGQLQGPMNFFSKVPNWWADSMNSAQRIFEVIDAVPEVEEASKPKPLKEPKGDIVLDNITFGYEVNRPVLKDVSLHIPAGSMVGIVGRSGAGKTTLVNLISRMYDVQEGEIRIDGIPIKELAFHDLRKNVAMVSQETFIFMGTVAENIAYANRDAGLKEIMTAAKLAGAHEFIMRMPDGYDTRIGASGRQLSGGERQRVSIARAILANPKILILDEATASVDTETERVIQKALNYLVKGRTTISIAHRLSTLRDADYLVVIDHGEVTECGTHEELEALKGTYYKLQELQTKALQLKGEMDF